MAIGRHRQAGRRSDTVDDTSAGEGRGWGGYSVANHDPCGTRPGTLDPNHMAKSCGEEARRKRGGGKGVRADFVLVLAGTRGM